MHILDRGGWHKTWGPGHTHFFHSPFSFFLSFPWIPPLPWASVVSSSGGLPNAIWYILLLNKVLKSTVSRNRFDVKEKKLRNAIWLSVSYSTYATRLEKDSFTTDESFRNCLPQNKQKTACPSNSLFYFQFPNNPLRMSDRLENCSVTFLMSRLSKISWCTWQTATSALLWLSCALSSLAQYHQFNQTFHLWKNGSNFRYHFFARQPVPVEKSEDLKTCLTIKTDCFDFSSGYCLVSWYTLSESNVLTPLPDYLNKLIHLLPDSRCRILLLRLLPFVMNLSMTQDDSRVKRQQYRQQQQRRCADRGKVTWHQSLDMQARACTVVLRSMD